MAIYDSAATVNVSCGVGKMECDIFRDMGPPPDMISSIPPPPVPPSMEEIVSRLAVEAGVPEVVMTSDDGCGNLCLWARGSAVGFVELAQKGPVIDDTWFLVIISSCVAATLIAIVMAIGCFKYRGRKLKPLSDAALAKKEKALGLERCEAVLYPGPLSPQGPSPDIHANTKALWAGLKAVDEKYYTVDHCEPMSQKQSRIDIIQNMENKYDYRHYSPINYSTVNNGVPNYTKTFENVGFVPGDEHSADIASSVSRAAYILGANGRGATLSTHFQQHQQPDQHHYEMVSPRNSPSSKRLMSLDRNGRNSKTLTISAPTNVIGVRLPPLNSRQYALTALANGRHTISKQHLSPNGVRRSQVAIDSAGGTMTSLAPSPTDHVYASPITSPVI